MEGIDNYFNPKGIKSSGRNFGKTQAKLEEASLILAKCKSALQSNEEVVAEMKELLVRVDNHLSWIYNYERRDLTLSKGNDHWEQSKRLQVEIEQLLNKLNQPPKKD